IATSLPLMIVARIIQGVGGGVLPLAFGIIRDEFPAARTSSAIGSLAALTAVGGGAGIVIAGPIVDALDYHWLFWLPLILISAAMVAAHFLVPESAVRSPGRINWMTAFLLSAWLVALLLAVSQGHTWGWTSPKVLILLVLAVIIAVVWVIAENRSDNPLIDMKMMRIPAVWTTNVVALLFGLGMYASFAFLPEFLQTPSSTGWGFGASITESGLMILPQTIGVFIVGTIAGRVGERLGSKNILVVGSIITLVAFLMLALLHSETWQIYLASSVMGIGVGMAFSAMSSLVVAAVPPEQTGVASGMNANIRTIGGSLGAALMATVVTAGVKPGALPKESGYTNGFLMLSAATLLGVIAAIAIPAVKRNTSTHRERHVDLAHSELALVAGGTVVGDESE
ncbi:MAG: transporter, partial [Pseudonocardiales bacterium]|nr:transporter [Pseudonocardiales bacterium]